MRVGAVELPGRQRAVAQLKERVGPLVASRRPRRIDVPLSHWGLSIGTNGTLHWGDHDLVELAREHGSPLYVVNGDRLTEAAEAAIAPCTSGAGADVFYSYKTNPIPAVLQRLHAAGIGAEVISAYEYWLARRLGVPGNRIIYNGPAKSEASVRQAIRDGVHLLNANSLAEVERSIHLAADEGHTLRLGIRVNLPGMWGGQFGLSSESPQVVEAVELARSRPEVDLVGLHVHQGGTIRTRDHWADHVTSVLDFCDALSETTDWSPSVVDFGGSLACPSSEGIDDRQFRLNRALGADLLAPDPATAITVGEAAALAADLTRDRSEARGLTPPELAIEPGRALTADTQLLLLRVHDRKDDIEPTHLIMDGGRNLADPLPTHFHQLISVTGPGEPVVGPYRLVGPICTPADVLYYNWELPRTEIGDLVAVMDAGAYFVPFSTSFSFPRPGIAVVGEDGIELARVNETYDDLVGRDVMPVGDEPTV